VIDYTWVRVTRKVAFKAQQTVRLTAAAVIAAKAEVEATSAAYRAANKAAVEAVVAAEAAIAAAKSARAKKRRVRRLIAAAKEAAVNSAGRTGTPLSLSWQAQLNAEQRLRDANRASDSAQWALRDALVRIYYAQR
jgi:hypothetical protein